MAVDWHGVLRRGVAATPRVAGRLAAGAFVAPIGVAAAITGLDALRKQRTTEVHEAPDDLPQTTRVGDNEITTYTYGAHLYEAMVEAIESATDHVYLASFILKGDATGQRFKDALVAAARRGVLVCVVFDGFANLVVPREFKRFPEGVHVLKFPHRSAWCGAGRRATHGAGTTARCWSSMATWALWGATTSVSSMPPSGVIRICGSRGRLSGSSPTRSSTSGTGTRRPGLPELVDTGNDRWDQRLRAARNEPSRVVFPVRGLYLEAIDRACDHVWITQGYFIPDREIKLGLLKAAERGVDVRVLTPQRSNHVVADWVARSYFTELLEGGVRIFLYQDAMVHAKTATVDGRWTTVGTANIDRLSMRGNYEVNLEIVNESQAAIMEKVFQADVANSREMTLNDWQDRNLIDRVVERVLRPLQPLL